MSDDLQLLHCYAAGGPDSQDAFATLVRRHIDLVYSVALRTVRSAQHAEDVVQSVFVDLATRAGAFPPAIPLVAWLHVVTRRTAIDLIRRESRRQAREHAASVVAMTTASSPWEGIEPLLEDAVESLPPADRTAILLRFFENRSLREVGAALGLGDDAAQKRVTRALERLRAFFLRRGVAVTAVGLATDLSAHALHTAPAALSGTIATASLSTLASTPLFFATLETSRVIAMTALQKTAFATAFVVVGGAGLYQATVLADQSTTLSALRSRTAQINSEMRVLHATYATRSGDLQKVERQIDARLAAAVSPADAALEAQMQEWRVQLDRLKRVIAQRPDWNIPELRLLTEQQWFDAASSGRLDTEDALRRASAQLRHRAENHFAQKLKEALAAYLKAHDGTLPREVASLAPFLDPALPSAVLDRYAVLRTGRLADIAPADRRRILASRSPADVELDAYWYIGVDGYGNTPALGHALQTAARAFREANPGERPTLANQLTSHLPWPVDPTKVQEHLNRLNSRPQ